MTTRKLEVDGVEVTISARSPFDRRVPMCQEEKDLCAFSSTSLAFYSFLQEAWSYHYATLPEDNCLPELAEIATNEYK